MGDLWGKSDPYVKLTLEDAKGEIHGDMKTSTKTDDLDPTWDDEAFSFAPEGPHLLDCSLRFRVNDTAWDQKWNLVKPWFPSSLCRSWRRVVRRSCLSFRWGLPMARRHWA